MKSTALMAAVLLCGSVAQGNAQGGPPSGPPGGAPLGAPVGRGVGQPQRGGGEGRLNEAQRLQMERRLQDRINQAVRQRLRPTEEQFTKLREVAARMEEERRVLRMDDQTARFAMRQELAAGDKANEAHVAELLDQMQRFERRRFELMEREQKELAKFLTPSQRARYIGLQDQLRMQMQEIQQRRQGVEGDAPVGPPLGARRLRRPPGTP